MFSNPLGEEDHNPAQRETGDCKGLRFHMDTNQVTYINFITYYVCQCSRLFQNNQYNMEVPVLVC